MLGTSAYAQEAYTDYACGYSDKKYDIQIGKDGKLYIDVMSFDATATKAGLMLDRKREPDFSSCLDTAFKKYTEWKDIAAKNNVKELTKGIPCSCRLEGYFKYGDWQFDPYIAPTFEFTIIEAMAAGCHVVTTNYGALPETCGEFATMIEFDSSGQNLIERYAETLNSVIDNYKNNLYKDDLEMQIKYYNKNYSWETRIQEWINFLNYVRRKKTS